MLSGSGFFFNGRWRSRAPLNLLSAGHSRVGLGFRISVNTCLRVARLNRTAVFLKQSGGEFFDFHLLQLDQKISLPP